MVIVTTLIYIQFTPQLKLKKLKAEIKELTREAKTHLGNKDVLFNINKEMSRKNMEMMQSTLFPNMFMMVPMFFMIGYLHFLQRRGILILYLFLMKK